MTQYPPRPTRASVDGFVAAYEAFVCMIRAAALSGADGDGAPHEVAAASGLSKWQYRILPLLESKHAAIRAAAADFANGDASAIARCALEASSLAKDMDNCSFDFADPRRRQMDALVSRVVLAAYPVYAAAGLG